MKKSLFKLIVLLFMAFILSSCSSTNKYMIKDTNEYSKVTAKFIGSWGVTEYKVDGKNLLKSKYEKMTANFDYLTRTAKLTIWVTEGTIADKLSDWEKEFPGIKVNEYKIIYTSSWMVGPNGENIGFYNPTVDLVIKGSGENFDGFYQWEKTKFNMADASDDGTLMGAALGSLTKAATGTSDLFPEIEEDYSISYISDDGKNIKLVDDDDLLNLVK